MKFGVMLGEEGHTIMYFFLELCHSLHIKCQAISFLWPNSATVQHPVSNAIGMHESGTGTEIVQLISVIAGNVILGVILQCVSKHTRFEPQIPSVIPRST